MSVNQTEINGFLIDEFNKYRLEVGKSQGICPLCSHERKPENRKAKCSSYDWETGLGTCHNCNTTYQLHTYQRKGKSNKEYNKPAAINVQDPKELSKKVYNWFDKRKISYKTLNDLNITESIEFMPQVNKKVNTINFNYIVGDELVNIKYRDGRKNFKLYKGAEKVFYNVNSIVGYNTCIITEGELDTLAFHEAGLKNSVSVPNGATINNNNLDYLDNCIDYFTDKEKIYLALDTDKAGKALQKELIRRLGAEFCYTLDFKEAKDANEYLLLYGKDALANILNSAKPVPLENVTTFNDIENQVVDFVKHGFKPGFQVGLENFDKIFSTYTAQFITVTGIPSSGKSDFVDQMVIGYNQKYGWKTAFASPENAPIYLHIHKILRKIWGGMPNKSDIDGDKWKEIKDHINNNFYFLNMERFSLENVLTKGAELVKRKGIKCLVIDPYNKIRDTNAKTEDINKYTMEYLTKIETFCKKYDVVVFIVAHPTKMYKNDKGKIDEPNMYNIKGGGEWYDASYHGLLIHRDYEAKTTKVKVLKVKFQNLGVNGAEAYFTWEPRSGRFVPIISDEEKELPW